MPSLLKCTRSLKSALLRVGRWILLGAGAGIGVLHGVIVPRIDEFRPALEEQASRLLGVTVRIERIEAHSMRVIPSFDLHHVVFLDAQGRAALQLPLVKVVVLEPLVVEQPSVDIRRTKEGKLWIAAFPLPDSPSAEAAPPSLWDWLPEVQIFNGTVTLTDESDVWRNAPPLVLKELNALLRNRDGQHIVRVEHPRMQVKGNFNPRWEGVLFANTTPLPLTELNPYIPQFGQFTQGTAALNATIPTNGMPIQANWSIQNGILKLPRWFAQPAIALDYWDGSAQWTAKGIQSASRFANADAAGKATFRWDGHHVFDLQGSLSRADATQVHRYLPLVIPAVARDYVRDAVLGGKATGVEFKVKGDWRNFPFTHAAGLGEFQIAAHIEGGTLAYIPPSLLAPHSAQWPVLTDLSGDLRIDRDLLQVKNATAIVTGTHQQVRITKADADMVDLYNNPVVSVTGEAQGSLAEALTGVVKNSPLSEMLGGVLDQASVTGSADYRLHLTVPIAAPQDTTVHGSVTLADNEFHILPNVPRLTHAKGTIVFTESGFVVEDQVHAQSLGGAVQLEGGLHFPLGAERLHIQGNASAEGLELPPFVQGRTDYHASLGLQEHGLGLVVDSNLQGMRIALPAPFNKAADAVLPLHLERNPDVLIPYQDRIDLAVGKSLHVAYERDLSQATAQVLRGAIAMGLNADEDAPMPEEGVLANMQVESLNVNDWITALAQLPHEAGAVASAGYIPSIVGLRGQELTIAGRTFNDVVMGGTQSNGVWQAQIDSAQAKGTLEYQQATPHHIGRVHARLAHLILDAAVPSAAPTATPAPPAAPLDIPPLELDVVVDNLNVYGKSLGRVEMTALNHFTLTVPEAVLTAQRHTLGDQRTGMDFELAITDTGALLARFGMPDVIRHGKGKLQGNVTWKGSPMVPNWATLDGKINLNMGSGQFLKAEPGIAKLLGVVSLQALPRRLMLDFSDVFNEGFVFDSVRGDVEIAKGIATTHNLEMKGVMANARLQGEADIVQETQNLRVVVVPDINAGSASLIATTVNPAWGLGSFFAQLLFRQPFLDAITREFVIDGTWLEPNFTEVPRP